MENLVREMLAISPDGDRVCGCRRQESVDLSALMERQLTLDAGLLEQRDQRLPSKLTPGVTVTGDPVSSVRLWGTCLQRASLYSRRGQNPGLVWDGGGQPSPDGGEHGPISARRPYPTCLRHFTGREGSETGGSGLGLYLVKMILTAMGRVRHREYGGRGAGPRYGFLIDGTVDFTDTI